MMGAALGRRAVASGPVESTGFKLDSGVQGIHRGVHRPRRCYCVVISGCAVASGRGGFPKNRPCRWRCDALRPPVYTIAQKEPETSTG